LQSKLGVLDQLPQRSGLNSEELRQSFGYSKRQQKVPSTGSATPDQRSNTEIIRKYLSRRTQRDDVFRVTVALLQQPGSVEQSLVLLQNVKDAGIPLETIIYNAAISACEKGGRADVALELLREMQQAGIPPDTITYSAAISACEKGGRADDALALLREMQQAGIPPNTITYSAAISACEKGGRADDALALLREMQQAGIWPDIITYSAAISACQQANLHQKTQQLIDAAIEGGIYRKSVGYTKNTLNFHTKAVYADPDKRSDGRDPCVPAPVALALLDYHAQAGRINHATKFIVGQHGDDRIKNVILTELRTRYGSYVVDPHNHGRIIPNLIPAAVVLATPQRPAGRSLVQGPPKSSLNPLAPEFVPTVANAVQQSAH
jgi:pentatricopeptide repeat protein